ncbi:Exocyst complex component 2 [Trichuris trichiura]|uniref:Exocyst complex component 2 n=1 Tax=Trichuris trichiura TaxID=36087 RepID=A0A077Z9F8_TRITR|nr:Exocyst complex component 2 [Trichuris trichiura]
MVEISVSYFRAVHIVYTVLSIEENFLGMKSDPPLVTGLSPKEGPPGTQIIIRGENLGLSQSDVVGLIVCSMDCLASMRWESPHKIIARVTQSKAGIGDVTVITKSGGRGSCLVQFRIFHALIGPLQESAVWVDESHFVDSMRSAAEEMNVVIEDSPLTISKDSATGSNLRLENFHPVRYLLENYRTASYDSLEAALFHLENHSNLAQKEPKNFLKSNLSCILDCVDALCDLRDFIGSSEQPDYSKMLSTLRHQISVCSNCGEEVFVDVLKRKEQSDSIRNALTVLRRFRFLFLLPQAMKSHVEKGEYGLVTSEYSRAKSLLCETEVPLLKEGLTFGILKRLFHKWHNYSICRSGCSDGKFVLIVWDYSINPCCPYSGICELASKETWKLSECDKDMSKTALPDMFESIVNEVQPIVNTFLSHNNFPHEKDLLQLEAYRPSVLISLECLFCSFKITLERLINFEPSKRPPKLTEKKLLVVVANCDYVLRFCLPRLFERASKCGVWLIEPIQEVSSRLSISHSFTFFIGKEDDDVKSVSTYIKDCILRVVAVQAELFLVCPVLYHTVIGFVVKNYHDRITEHAKERLDTMSSQQRSQVILLESVKSFLSAETQLAIRNFKLQIGTTWTESLQLLLDNYLSKEELLISCLSRVAPASDT